ncbi:hypothetical protein L195_g043426 [Trifolium pratense]|uniref:Late embryogenesis abundant protein LEA-2 subgroup domain-containing protein n=1 Tax=Trifolium pratense TaxID=57577 RepID=A0A2K3LZF9_TRIPR|nr:hypothetical protein L195_g038539 [Trifolium pratense]PNX83925.1 hypothetical protein L195_g039975 [Trifolium pratense]PNX87339.1 hypothetical protein L195_g043426 [Trifolium pratense]
MEGQRAPQNNGTTTPDDIDRVVSPHLPLVPPPSRACHDNMYIVQFPKDQVYRIPPSENALIVERYRNPPPNEKKNQRVCCCSSRLLLTIAIILVTIIAIVGITLATLFIIYNPTGPIFTITNFAAKNVTKPPHYEISLRVKNPNTRLGIIYESSEISMLFDENEVAKGTFPKLLEQGKDSSTQFKVNVTGTSRTLPKKKGNTPMAFELDMNLGVRVAASGIKTWIMKSNVVCKFKVNNLGSDSRILSQVCDTHFKQY